MQVWSPLSPNVSLVDHADLMVAPKHAGHVKSYLGCSGMGVKVISDNLQRQIDLENVVEDLPPTRSKGKFGQNKVFHIHLKLILL